MGRRNIWRSTIFAKPEVLDSPDYDRVAGDKSGPWTKRVTQAG